MFQSPPTRLLGLSHPSATKPRPANHRLLRGPVGRCQRGAASVLVGGRAAERGTGQVVRAIGEGQEGSSHALTTGITWDEKDEIETRGVEVCMSYWDREKWESLTTVVGDGCLCDFFVIWLRHSFLSIWVCLCLPSSCFVSV